MKGATIQSRPVGRLTAALVLAMAMATLGLLPATPTFAHGPQTIPSGTSMRIRVETDMRSTNVRPGDAFRATVVAPINAMHGEAAVPTGSVLEGHVASVDRARGWGQPSGVTLELESLTSPHGETVNVVGELTDLAGNALVTVENLTRGTELAFRATRSFVVPEAFYLGDDTGDDFFDSPATVEQAQTIMRDLGYYSGPIDGRLSQATRMAIGAFQRDQRLSATGSLDRATIDRLGLVGESGQEVTAANVLSADAALHAGDRLHVRVVAEMPAPDWQVFEDHFRQRDALHLYVRAVSANSGIRPGTRKELDVVLEPNEWRGVARLVVHGAGRNVEIASSEFAGGGGLTAEEAAALEAQIVRTLRTYAGQLGIRYNAFNGQIVLARRNYRQNEIELLFALNSLASSARLYTQLRRSTDDPDAVKGATDLYIAQAKMVDAAIARTRSNRADAVARSWTDLRDTFDRMHDGGARDSSPGYGYR